MNVRRFTARTARDALSMVRIALGGDAVVLSTKPSAEGVEVLAMAPEGMRTIEHLATTAPHTQQPSAAASMDFQDSVMPAVMARPAVAAKPGQRIEQSMDAPSVEDDVQSLSMSTW